MRKKLVNEKRDALKGLSRKELIDRILNYPNQDLLNLDADGNKRKYPLGWMAGSIRNNDYQMTDKQYYTLVHYFAAATVPDMRVVGVSFYENDAQKFEKTLVFKEGGKSVYETDYVLRPEPENPHDKNAVMVLVRETDGELHHLGYINRGFVSQHQITEEMTVHGLLTDHSNGNFKNVSYSLAIDTEKLDTGRSIYECRFSYTGVLNTPFHTVTDARMMEDLDRLFAENNSVCTAEDAVWEFGDNGNGVLYLETTNRLAPNTKDIADLYARTIGRDTTMQLLNYTYKSDISIKVESGFELTTAGPSLNGQEDVSQSNVYERNFRYNGIAHDAEDISNYVPNETRMVEDLNGDLEKYGCTQYVERMEWKFNQDNTGSVVVALGGLPNDNANTPSAISVINSYVNYEMNDGPLSTILRENGFIDVPYSETVFVPDRNGFHQIAAPMQEEQSQTAPDSPLEKESNELYEYRTDFKLDYPVNDFEAARDYLHDDDMAAYLREDLVEGNRPAVAQSLVSVSFDLDDEQHGHVSVVMDMALSASDSAYISEWIKGQASDGLGEGFEQRPFAQCWVNEGEMEEEYDDEDEAYHEVEAEPVYEMCSFDWETNNYGLTLVNAPENAVGQDMQSFAEDVNALTDLSRQENGLGLTDADLDFGGQVAGQMSLADYGV